MLTSVVLLTNKACTVWFKLFIVGIFIGYRKFFYFTAQQHLQLSQATLLRLFWYHPAKNHVYIRLRPLQIPVSSSYVANRRPVAENISLYRFHDGMRVDLFFKTAGPGTI